MKVVEKLIDAQLGGGSVTVDNALSLTSVNPVENRVITNALKTVTGLDITDPANGMGSDGKPNGQGALGGGGGVTGSSIVGDVSGIMDGTKVSWVIGLVQTEAFETDNPTCSVMSYVDNNFNPISVTKRYFDAHPSYQFEDEYFGSSVYVRVPKAYWRRMRVPEWKPNAGQWVMFLSPEPLEGFSASPAFRYRGQDKDSFSVGKYMASKSGNNPASLPNATPWTNVTFDAAESACRGLGEGHHLMSVYERDELVLRMAMEHRTFAFPYGKYYNKSWRGFEEWLYRDSNQGLWLNGIRTDANVDYEIWDTDGQQRYERVEGNVKLSGSIGGTIAEGGRFDHMLLPGSAGNGITGDRYYAAYSSRVAAVGCYDGSYGTGAAGLHMYWRSSSAFGNVGFRSAKI